MPAVKLPPKKIFTSNEGLFLAIFFLYMGALYYGGPHVDEASIAADRLWLDNIYFNENFGISLNKDAYYYMASAKKPATLLETGYIIQSRPLLALAAALPTYIIDTLFLSEYADISQDHIGYYIAPYISLVLINILVLMGSIMLYRIIIAKHLNSSSAFAFGPLYFLIGFLLLFNDVTKAFLLNPHTQMFNIFVPVFSLYIFLYTLFEEIHFKKTVLIFVLCGLGTLAYGSFIIVLPLSLLAITFRYFYLKTLSKQETASLIGASFIIILPSFFWYLLVKALSGSYYSHELERWRLFIWMLDTFESGGWATLFSRLIENVTFFLWSLYRQSRILLILVVVLLVMSIKASETILNTLASLNKIVFSGLAVSLSFLLFFSFVGYNVERLAYSAVPPLIIITGSLAQSIGNKVDAERRHSFSLLIWTLILLYGFFVVVKAGPYY